MAGAEYRQAWAAAEAMTYSMLTISKTRQRHRHRMPANDFDKRKLSRLDNGFIDTKISWTEEKALIDLGHGQSIRWTEQASRFLKCEETRQAICSGMNRRWKDAFREPEHIQALLGHEDE
jgi:hypothetical protein